MYTCVGWWSQSWLDLVGRPWRCLRVNHMAGCLWIFLVIVSVPSIHINVNNAWEFLFWTFWKYHLTVRKLFKGPNYQWVVAMGHNILFSYISDCPLLNAYHTTVFHLLLPHTLWSCIVVTSRKIEYHLYMGYGNMESNVLLLNSQHLFHSQHELQRFVTSGQEYLMGFVEIIYIKIHSNCQ